MKTAEEIAREIMRKHAKSGCVINVSELEDVIAQAILVDRKERDERVIEVLETLYAADLNDTNCVSFEVANRRIRAVVYPLLAELRKEQELNDYRIAKEKAEFTLEQCRESAKALGAELDQLKIEKETSEARVKELEAEVKLLNTIIEDGEC